MLAGLPPDAGGRYDPHAGRAWGSNCIIPRSGTRGPSQTFKSEGAGPLNAFICTHEECRPLRCKWCSDLKWSCEVYISTVRKKTSTCVCKPCHLGNTRKNTLSRGDGRSRNWTNRGVEFTDQDYQNLLKEQDGKCAGCLGICITGRSLAVDHDHVTGEVRGLLCFNCNTVLGKVSDSASTLMRLALYIQNSNDGGEF